MIIKNGTIQYCTTQTTAENGRDADGNIAEDARRISAAYDCNMEVKTRTYYAGGDSETYTQAVYSIIVEHQPPENAHTAILRQVDGVAAGEAKIVNVEPLVAVKAYKITAHANQR